MRREISFRTIGKLKTNVNGLDGGVVLQSVLAELAADTGLLVASEGNLGVELVVAAV
jgi:hypothetical protein